jgi:steroid delta-isomerase-like uncharacterized protein
MPGIQPSLRRNIVTATNRALAIRWMEEVWNDRLEATIDQLLAPDGVGHMEGIDVHGPAEFRAVRSAFLSAFPDLRIKVDATVADGDCVVVRWTVVGTHFGEGLGFAASGMPVTFRGMSWMRFSDGKVVETWDSWNQGALMANLRPSPPAP